jgi:putative salt-induced outer membrane protein
MRLRLLSAALVFAAPALLLPASADAQTPPPPRQEASAELAFVGTTGNTSTSTFSAGVEHMVRPADWLLRNRGLIIRSRAAGATRAESLLYAFRAERRVGDRLSAFGDYSYFRDQPAGILRRNSLTAGLSTTLSDDDGHKLTADVGAGAIREIRAIGADVSSATWSVGAAYAFKISDTASLTDDVRILGLFDRKDDWRVTHALAVTAKLNSLFSLKFSSVVRYARVPPPGFKRADTTTTIALVAAFKRL